MKITKEHYIFLYNAIKKIYDPVKISQHRKMIIAENKPNQNIDMRIRWDLLWFSDRNMSTWVCKNLYQYLDDENIDTALRKIMKELSNEETKN